MSHPQQPGRERSKMAGVYEFAQTLTIYGTPILLALIGVFLVLNAFGQSLTIGFRSLAGFLFPLIMASFLYVFNRELLERTGGVSTVIGFFTGFGLGIVLMLVLELTPQGRGVPLAEIVVSGCFSVLVFFSISSSSDKVLTYYYGTLIGLLVYVIARGVPLLTD